MAKAKLAVLISGSGSNLQAIIEACSSGLLNAEIICVISNVSTAYGLERAKNAGIKTYAINHKEFASREEFDKKIDQVLVEEAIDLICLAGFMRLLTKEFTNKWYDKIINIHPSLLPSFKGAHAIKDAFEYGVKVTGCTVHFVRAEVDSGPIITQKTVLIDENDTIESLASKIHKQEHIAYVEALQLIIDKKIKIIGNKVEIFLMNS